MAVPTYKVELLSTDGATRYDITSYVRSVSTSRGRNRQLDKFEAGSFSVVLDNRLRYFDPKYNDYTDRYNLVKNPIPAYPGPAVSPQETWQILNRGTGGAGTTVLSSSGATDTVTTAASTNSYSFGLTGGSTAARIPVTAGLTYAVSMYVTSSINDVRRLQATFYDTGGTSLGDFAIGAATTLSAGIQVRMSGTVTAPANAVSMRFWGGSTTGSIIRTVGSTMNWRWALVEESSTVGSYFSGNTANTNYEFYVWTGTTEASSSRKLTYPTPFFDLMTVNRAISITSANQPQFNGFIRDWNYNYDISGDSVAYATGTDAFGFLANQTLTAGTATSQLSGERLDAVVADPNISWPYGGVYTLFDAGRHTLQADVIASGTNALDYIQLVETTEGGYFYVDAFGNLTFKQSGSANVSLWEFTDADASSAYKSNYQGIEINYGSELLYNQITLSRIGGATVTVDKPISIANYGAVAYEETGLLFNSDNDTTNAALLLARQYAEPEYRFDSVTINVNTLSASRQAALLLLDLTDIVKVTFTPNQIGSSISKYVRILGIDNQMNTDQHIITYRFGSVETEQLILDDEVFGLLDYNLLGW